MINRLEEEIKKLQEQLREQTHNKDALESLQQKILYRELQILHPKECLTSKNRRRTWAPSSSAIKPIVFENFIVPATPEFPSLLAVPSGSSSKFINCSRGTKSNSPISDNLENSFLNESEMFIPGELAFLSDNRISPTIQRIINENEVHTPQSFKLKKNLLTPEILRVGHKLAEISKCENCSFVEQELQELREFTKLEYKLDNGEIGWDLLVKQESEKIIQQLNECKDNYEITHAR